MNRLKKGLALLLSLAMIGALLPETAFAVQQTGVGYVGAEGADPKGEEAAGLEAAREGMEPGQGEAAVRMEPKQGGESSSVASKQGGGVGTDSRQGEEAVGTAPKRGEEAGSVAPKQGEETVGTAPKQGEEAGGADAVQGGESGGMASIQGGQSAAEAPAQEADGQKTVQEGEADAQDPALGEGFSAQGAFRQEEGRSQAISFRVLTEGQELHHTKADKEFYRFQPGQSGWYRLIMQSRTDCKFSAGVQQVIYYENSVEKKQDYSKNTRYMLFHNSQMEQLMWLDQEEIYEFYCAVSSYEDPDNLDVALHIKRAGISGMETAAQPTGISNDAWIGTGMKVKVRYEDGDSVTSEVDCSYTSYGGNNGSSINTLRVLNWSDIAHKKTSSISRQIQVRSLDGNTENLDIYQLAEGEHDIGLGIRYNQSGAQAYYEFQARFQVAHNPVEAITVTQKTDSYTHKFGQTLEPVTIEAVRKDGTKETFSSNSAAVFQYLAGREEEGPGGTMFPMRYMDIDSYMAALEEDGELGKDGVTKADVVVEYQGIQATYPITIAENPYNGISVTPGREIYYLDASDSISESDLGGVLLSRKDGAEADGYRYLSHIPGNRSFTYGNYGLRLEGKDFFYKNIKGYQDAGGTAGKKQVTVTYLDYQASFAVELRENPYERIEIAENPEKTEYVYTNYPQSLKAEGMVFRAYKPDGTYDTYTYGSKEGAVQGWDRYFRITADSSAWYYQEGEHTVTASFMDHKAEYKIRLDKEPEPEEPVYTRLKILKAPKRTVYYTGEPDTIEYGSVMEEDGLELELTDSKGTVKKYRYGMYEEKDGYSSWNEIWWEVEIGEEGIDWAKPGTYQVQVTCQDLEEAFDIVVTDSPVVSFDIVSMPTKDVYFRYEGWGMDLKGLSYQITFDDGSIHAETLGSPDPYMEFQYQGRNYRAKKDWVKKNSSGSPTFGENGIKFTLFGKEYRTGPIAVRQDPVASIEFIKAPEKQFYGNNDIDLYGAKFRINYTDGTKHEVEAKKHNSYVIVEDAYGKILDGRITYSMDVEDGYSQKILRVAYMNASAELPVGFKPTEVGGKQISDGGQTGLMALDKEHPYHVLSFTPEKTGNYYFYCIGAEENGYYPFHTELYEGNRSIYSVQGSGWYSPFTFWGLEEGVTYYIAVGGGSSEYGKNSRFQCYLSSSIASQADLGEVEALTVGTEGVKDTWYAFDFQNAYIGYLGRLGISYQVTYGNQHGWSEVKYPSALPVPVGGKMLSAEWKYKRSETDWEDMEKPEIREDNAIQFKWGGEVVKELPVRLDAPSPVESITIDNNPFEGCYQYQASKGFQGLSVTIHYTKADGRPDKTVVWEDSFSQPSVDGYDMQVSWKAVGQPGGEGAVYQLQVSYMDASDQKDIAFLPNPVTGFTLKEKPVKDSYYSFEDMGSADLYGMEITVNYRDGKKEALRADGHGSVISLSDGSGEQVKGSIRKKGESYVLYLESRGFQQEAMEYTKLPLPASGAEEIKEGQAKYTVIGKGHPFQVYKMQAAADSKYTFHVKARIRSTVYLYGGDGEQLDALDLSAGHEIDLDRSFGKGETAYYVLYAKNQAGIGSMACTLRGEEIQKEGIPSVRLNVDEPVAGQELPQVLPQVTYEGYGIDSYQWYGGEDGYASFAAAHRLKVILSPDLEHYFTGEAKVTVNGDEASYTLESNGTISMYYTFPHTECKMDFQPLEGYTLHIRNDKKDRVSYGEDFSFQYLDVAGAPDPDLTVKANGNIVPLGGDGLYTIEDVTENTAVIARPKYLEVGDGESLLALHNKGKEIYGTMVGKRNQSIQDNVQENTLPMLPSYQGGSSQFFYGWYLGKDEAWNGRGTRFTSVTKLLEEYYDLYAKWGSGYFTGIADGKQVQYQVMSFDEQNRMKVQVKKLAGKQAKLAARAAAQAAEAAGRLEIPAVLGQGQISMEEGLDLEIASCQVAAVAEGAFSGDTSLTEIILPDTVEEIGADAFSGCAHLEKVTLPARISGIEAGTFSGCTALKGITLPGSVEEIGQGAFSGCTALKDITLPGSVEEIGENAFSGCTALEEIIVPEGVAGIGQGAFSGCTSLRRAEIPDSVTELPAGLFQGCENLAVILPDSIEKIDASAFAGAKGVSLICSSQLAGSPVIKDLQTAGGAVQAVSFALEGDSVLYYGEPGHIKANFQINGETVEGRNLVWEYPETDAFAYQLEGNTLRAVPKRKTGADEKILVTVKDTELGLEASMRLRAISADLSRQDGEGAPLYEVGLDKEEYVYSGVQYRPGVVVKRASDAAALGALDYTVAYVNNQKAGTAQVVITGKGNYAGTIRKAFVIAKAGQHVIASDLVWNVKEPIVAIGASSSGDGPLSYRSSNEKVASIDASGIAVIHGVGTASISIQAAETENFKKSAVKTITLTVRPSQSAGSKPKSQLKIPNTSYTKALGSKPFALKATAKTAISYKSSNPKVAAVSKSGKVTLKKCGKAVITIKTHDASKKATVRVVPKKASVKKAASPKAGWLKVSWSRQKEASGYVIECSLDKKFKKKVTRKAVGKNSITSTVVKKLPKGKKFYIRVKAYTLIGKQKAYGASSKTITARCKK